jgi:hypothetical protein
MYLNNTNEQNPLSNFSLYHSHPLNLINVNKNCKCNICENLLNGNAYSCVSCDLSVCQNCGNRLINGKPNTSVHMHQLQGIKGKNWKCDFCKKIYVDCLSFNCENCNFDCCTNCYCIPKQPQQQTNYQQQQNYAQQPNYQQQQNYVQQNSYPPQSNYPQQQQPMYPQQSNQQQQSMYPQQSNYPQQQSMYPQQQYGMSQQGAQPQQQFMNQNNSIPHEHQVSNGILNSRLKCDICGNHGTNQPCYSCRQCDLDICQDCCNKIFFSTQKNIHPHQLLLITHKNDWLCNVCRNYSRKVSMNCKNCNYNCCINCYSKGYVHSNNNNQCKIF